MKKYFLITGLFFVAATATAQKKTGTQKVVATSEKINKKSQEISNASSQAAGQMAQAGENAKVVAANVKKIIKVFEPILQHFKRNKKINAVKTSDESGMESSKTNPSAGSDASVPVEFPSYPSVPPAPAGSDGNSTGYPEFPEYGTPINDCVNADGSANWGNQSNPECGFLLDAFKGEVKDLNTGEENPNSIDLIFLAPADGQNAYYLITPDFAKNNASADAFWGSATTDNPIKKWSDVNESEVAETKITGAQFFKIKTNPQILSAVKSARGYASFYSSTSKLDGKVFAVKTNMHNRDTYALIYVAKHIGTSGSSGCLKIFIKCAGIDTNGDGNPDAANYERAENN